MPDLRPVNDLRQRLAQALALSHMDRSQGWAPKPAPIAAELAATVAAFGRDSEPPPTSQAMVEAVRAFVRHRQVQNFTHLKHLCFGVTIPYDATARLIDHKLLFPRLIELVDERQSQAKPFRRCYQGLLSGYFAFERRDMEADVGGHAGRNWLALRSFLGERLDAVMQTTTRLTEMPIWLSTLLAHKNLLKDQPCKRYAADLRRGNLAELKQVFSAMEIQGSSWVWHEAVLAYMLELVEDADRPFKADLRIALDMVSAEDKERKLPGAVAKTATALLVMRYAKCQDRPEHPQLRDICIDRIGNPWLQRAAWDGAVRDEDARRMVESWLKRGLIRDFFGLLSHDGAADQRRLNYWLRWEPQVSDMWFALGGDALMNRSAEFRSIRARMRGRERRLSGAVAGDNAFIMRIRDAYIVEFGLKGTACFVFADGALPLDLDDKEVSLPLLRANTRKLRLIHRGAWESDFDAALRQHIAASVGGTVSVSDRQPAASTGFHQPEPKPAAVVRQPAANAPIPAPASASSSGVQGVWPEYKRPADGSVARRQDPSKPRANSPSRRPDLPIGWDREVRQRAAAEGLKVDDRRDRHGAYWLLVPKSDQLSSEFKERLAGFGFRWVVGKGFYLDTDD